MTKREALHLAVHSLEQQQGKSYQEAIELLHKIELEVCRKQWSRESIIEAFNSWTERTGMPPTVTNLSADCLPNKSVVERVFGEKASVVLRNLYSDASCRRKYCDAKYRTYTEDQLMEFLREQFSVIQPSSGKDYNRHRLINSPAWETMAKRLHCHSWKELWSKVMGETFIKNCTCKVIKVEVSSPVVDTLNSFVDD